jgi:hypothetical protein
LVVLTRGAEEADASDADIEVPLLALQPRQHSIIKATHARTLLEKNLISKWILKI